jgi:hypothetical protein
MRVYIQRFCKYQGVVLPKLELQEMTYKVVGWRRLRIKKRRLLCFVCKGYDVHGASHMGSGRKG